MVVYYEHIFDLIPLNSFKLLIDYRKMSNQMTNQTNQIPMHSLIRGCAQKDLPEDIRLIMALSKVIFISYETHLDFSKGYRDRVRLNL